MLIFPSGTFPATDDTLHICFNDSLSLNNQSTITSGNSIENYAWSYGNGISSNLENPIYIPPNAGIYNIELITTGNNGCSDTANQPLIVHHYATTDFSFEINGNTINSNPNAFYQFCVGDSIHLYNLSTITPPDSIENTYWTINGEIWSSGADTSLFVPNDTSYHILLTTIAEGGCIRYDSINIRFNTVFPPDISIVKESCNGANDGSITINNIEGTHSGQYYVSVFDQNQNVYHIDTVNNGGNINLNNMTNGSWAIQVLNVPGCSWDTVVNIGTVSPIININATLGHINCFGTNGGSIIASTDSSGYTFVITDSSGTIVNTNGTNIANNLSAGTYLISVTDDVGCVSTSTVQLNQPPQMNIISTTISPLCYNDNTGQIIIDTVINYQGVYTQIDYEWTPNISSGQNQKIFENLSAGNYALEIQDSAGCLYSKVFSIVNPPILYGRPKVEAPSLCRTAGYQSGNGIVSVFSHPDSSGTPPTSFFWKNLSNGQTSIHSTFVLRSPGLVSITITDGNNCTWVDTILVDSITPIADFIIESDLFTGPAPHEGTEVLPIEITNLSSNFSHPFNQNSDSVFLWNLYRNQKPDGDKNWFFSFSLFDKIDTIYHGEEIYEVCLIAKNYNNCADTLCKNVIVHEIPSMVLPNVFTPGHEPNSSFFFPSEGIESFNCIVMNRYGVPVYEFNSISDKWNGNNYKNGKPCTDGVYFFTYKAISTNGKVYKGDGQVTLIRTN